jgi:hypothetical protein
MAGPVTEPLAFSLGAVLRAARAKLWATNLAESLTRGAWLAAAVLGAAAFVHLLLRPLPRALVPIALAASFVLALAETLRRAPTESDCARWADAELDGRTTFTASLAIGTGRLSGTTAAISWLERGLRETAVRSLAQLATRRVHWPLAALTTTAITALAAALVLSLPGGGALAAWREARQATHASQLSAASPGQRGTPLVPALGGIAPRLDPEGQALRRLATSPGAGATAADAEERKAAGRGGSASSGSSEGGGREAGAGKGSLAPADALVRAVQLHARQRELLVRGGAGAGSDAPGDAAYLEGEGEGERAPALATGLRAAPSVPPPRVATGAEGPLESLLAQRYASSRARAP